MSHRGKRLRALRDPFVVAAPAGARIRTRLQVTAAEAAVLRQVGEHLGALASKDLAVRCADGNSDAQVKAYSRRFRKQELTAASSSRWAGAITRTSEDSYQLRMRNLKAEVQSLHTRVKVMTERLTRPAGSQDGSGRPGYADQAERYRKQQRLQVLSARLAAAEATLASSRLSVCRGGRPLAHTRHHLDDAKLTSAQWREQWTAQRLFLCADGEADKAWGNETIRWNPDTLNLQIKLPAPLAHLANARFGRFTLAGPVDFPHRRAEIAAQAATGAVRYDITYHPAKKRWYLDASWKTDPAAPLTLEQVRYGPVVAVDVNVGHLAVATLTADGQPINAPITIALNLAGLPATTRDARIRGVISQILRVAADNRCGAVVIEDLNFEESRIQGRERQDNRPRRGSKGRAFRRSIAGIPTGQFRGRLVQMASNAALAVVAVDPAYTSKWGAEHWLPTLKTQFNNKLSGHHAAAVVIGRRGLDQRAKRKGERVTDPHQRMKRATPPHGVARVGELRNPFGGPSRAVAPGLITVTAVQGQVNRKDSRRPSSDGSKTERPNRQTSTKEAQDRSGPPTIADPLLRRV